MKDLYEKTEHWVKKQEEYSNIQDFQGEFQKKDFYSEKILIPISTLNTLKIIDSLPEAPEEECITIEMKVLYDKTQAWLVEHKCENNPDSPVNSEKNIFYSEKVVIPISVRTIRTIIDSLPEAPEFFD